MEIGISIREEITSEIEDVLRKCGMIYRMFSRGKSEDSLTHKIEGNPGKYSPTSKKIQDGLGIRVVFYFLEDVRTFSELLRNNNPLTSSLCDISDSEDDYKKIYSDAIEAGLSKMPRYSEVFQPQRLNFVFRMDDEKSRIYQADLKNSLQKHPEYAEMIDTTFELQVRSVLSEGWHEVEHDMRYKCKDDTFWSYCELESRALNGIYASLETQEYALERLFERMAYLNYRNQDWEAMIRNHFRLSMNPYAKLSEELDNILTNDTRIAKKLISTSRRQLQLKILKVKSPYPLTYDNIVFLCNRMQDKINENITKLELLPIKERLNALFGTNT